ncbi:hypothetical protein ACDZ94_20315 [Pseudomonas sp. UBT]|uniref:hypothetical protein n=1 Tax=Pseudomonas sp. UBT TaxID=3239198 RepID=UPI003D8032A9
MSEVKRYHVTEAGLVEGQALGRINVVLGSDYDSAVQCFLTAAEGCVAAERRERALQRRLSAADERVDTATSLIQRIVANFDTEIECHEDVEPNDLEHDQVLTEMREFLNPKDTEWRMHPCKNGHRDVGAAGGVAHCYTCDEKITAASTQEAFEQWNATHPAS